MNLRLSLLRLLLSPLTGSQSTTEEFLKKETWPKAISATTEETVCQQQQCVIEIKTFPCSSFPSFVWPFFFLVRSVRVTSLFLTQSVPPIVTVSFLQTSHLPFFYLPNCSFMGHAQLNSSLHFPQCISGKVPHKQQQQTTTYIWLNNVTGIIVVKAIVFEFSSRCWRSSGHPQ